jgi:hypothetical protein
MALYRRTVLGPGFGACDNCASCDSIFPPEGGPALPPMPLPGGGTVDVGVTLPGAGGQVVIGSRWAPRWATRGE